MDLIVFCKQKSMEINQNYFWGKKPNFDICEHFYPIEFMPLSTDNT